MAITSPRRSATAPSVPPRLPRVAPAALALLATTVLCGALAAGLATRALGLAGGPTPLTIDALVELAVTGTGALVAGWLAGSTLLALGCLAARLVGSSWWLGERLVHRFAPALVRRTLVVVVGATVGLGAATGASAVDPTPTPTPSVASVSVTADDLGWVVTAPARTAEAAVATMSPVPARTDPQPANAPDSARAEPPAERSGASASPAGAEPDPEAAAATSPVTTPAVAPPTPARTTAATAPTPGTADADPVIVAAGDSLWAIAARHLAPDATDAEIATSWPQWYQANADVIGADPGLIVPGQQLTAPVVQDGATS